MSLTTMVVKVVLSLVLLLCLTQQLSSSSVGAGVHVARRATVRQADVRQVDVDQQLDEGVKVHGPLDHFW